MRDAVLDRFVQPAVNRLGLPIERTARELACAYGALMLTSSAWTFDLATSSWLGAALQAVFVTLLVRGLIAGAGAGSFMLNSPFAPIHMLMRVVFLGIGVMSITQFALSCLFGLADGSTVMVELAQDLSMLCVSASLYVSVCDQPPPRRRRDVGLARA